MINSLILVISTGTLFGIAVFFNISLMVAGWVSVILIYVLMIAILFFKHRNTGEKYRVKKFFSDAVFPTTLCLIGASLISIVGVIAPA